MDRTAGTELQGTSYYGPNCKDQTAGTNYMDRVMRVKNFSLQQTLECGQCFNFEKIDENEYVVMAYGRVLHVIQHGASEAGNPKAGSGEVFANTESELEFVNAAPEDIQNIWVPYFDLDRDYDEIKAAVIAAEPRLESVIKKYGGIRILNQEFPETLLSFIISQNKNIPQIKKIVRSICDGFSKSQETVRIKTESGYEDRLYHPFPDVDTLKNMTEDDFRTLKTGFRAPYLINAIRAMYGESGGAMPEGSAVPKAGELPEVGVMPESGTLPEQPELLQGEKLKAMSFEEAKTALTGIKGVGDKVANCVLLFSLGFRSAFPVDVWIKRVMEEMYFGCDTPKKEIEHFALEKFGKWGGYAQQYLFMYIREK